MKCKKLFKGKDIKRVVIEDRHANIYGVYPSSVNFDYVIEDIQGNSLKLNSIYLRSVMMSNLKYREIIFEVKLESEV